jgi:pantoate--beta-alanine ligase
MDILHASGSMQARARELKATGKRIALVPTMGYLHEGHLSLVRIARQHADVVVLSLFVNPTQFGPGEDLDRYPRDLARDEDLCRREGVDILFVPVASSMYASDHTVNVREDTLSRGLCGASRPGHFGGVLTVVAQLFNLTLPDVAVFGEKDAQQIRLIRRMVRDLHFPVRILGATIVREHDGLAMSSRNVNLAPDARAQATCLYRSLVAAQAAFDAGERNVAALEQTVRAVLAEAPLGKIDYIAFVDDDSLAPVSIITEPTLIALAVQFPGARLIDNRTLYP